ncbi:MAG TPA: NAD(P)/FAD-dependent oxidoreductase [Propionibacteriaceae bacterium]
MTHVQTAIVVGGGIAGPVTAMALQRAGIEATVHEAYAKAADGVGGMLGLAPNGLDALAAIDLDGPVRHVAEPVSAMVVQSWTGKQLAQFDDPSGKPIMHVVWRPDLYRALYDEARRRGITIEHSHRFVDARESGDGVTARFSDDSTARADILIGADGSRSTIRSMIDLTAPPPRYTGLLGLGGLTTRAGVDSTNANYRMIFGKKAFFGYEVSDEGQISWFANLPHRDPLTLAQTREVSPEEWLRVLRDAFAADRTPAAAIIAATSPADLMVIGGLEIIPTAPVWGRGRSVIVGDAAHVPSPSSGQGASMAIESAIELARCLRDLPYAQAFAAYENLRRERVTRIIKLAARTNSHKAAGPLTRRLRDVIMPMAMKLAKPEKTAWQYNHHIEWDAPATNTVVTRRPRLTESARLDVAP